MELYYFPSYSGSVYLGDEPDKTLKYGTKVVDTEGLVNFFCLHAGLIFPNEKKGERFAQYCNALSKVGTSNVFANSFKIDPINTAMQCLKWRDALRLAKWNRSTAIPSNLDRLTSLQEVENQLPTSFHVGVAEKLEALTLKISKLGKGASILLPRLEPEEKINIHIPCDRNLLHPAIKNLLDLLESIKNGRTALVKIVLIKLSNANSFNVALMKALLNDDIKSARSELESAKSELESAKSELESAKNNSSISNNFKIINFEQLSEATQYIAFNSDKYNVWINTSNTTLPYYKAAASLPLIEEQCSQGMSQCRQLLIAGLNLFFKPLNLQALMQWLTLPIHPLAKGLRENLNRKISKNDSLFNDDCKEVLNDYIKDLEHHSKKSAIDDITIYIPVISYSTTKGFSFDTTISNIVDSNKLNKFLSKLEKWINSNLGAQYRDDAILAELPAVAEDIEFVEKCLNLFGGTSLTTEQLTNIIQLIYDYPTTVNMHAEVGSPNVVNRPELVAAPRNKTNILWCDFYGDQEIGTMYDFLNKSELNNVATMGLTIWEKEKELQMNHYFQLIPFIKSANGKLTLITCDGDGPTAFHQHPLMAHLKALVHNALTIIDGHELLKDLVRVKYSQPLSNTLDAENAPYYLIPSFAANGKWPTKDDPICPDKDERKLKRYVESYSSINDLIYYPLNYCFKYIAGIKENNFDALSPACRLKGNVVHKVIEKLFGQYKGSKPTFSVADFNSIFEETINECALVFREPANTFMLQSFKEQTQKSVMNLKDIIDINGFIIGGCEYHYDDIKFFTANNIRIVTNSDNVNHRQGESADMGFILQGSIDMWLYKEDGGCKKYYIFDFKWTSDENKFIKKLQDNTSIQLCLYKYALQVKEQIPSLDDISTAYYVLASAKLFTCASGIQKSVVINVKDAKTEAELLKEIMNSYGYRKHELQQGLIEDGENLLKSMSNYSKDTIKEGLLPLEFSKDSLQCENPFNDYKVFTTNRK